MRLLEQQAAADLTVHEEMVLEEVKHSIGQLQGGADLALPGGVGDTLQREQRLLSPHPVPEHPPCPTAPHTVPEAPPLPGSSTLARRTLSASSTGILPFSLPGEAPACPSAPCTVPQIAKPKRALGHRGQTCSADDLRPPRVTHNPLPSRAASWATSLHKPSTNSSLALVGGATRSAGGLLPQTSPPGPVWRGPVPAPGQSDILRQTGLTRTRRGCGDPPGQAEARARDA